MAYDLYKSYMNSKTKHLLGILKLKTGPTKGSPADPNLFFF